MNIIQEKNIAVFGVKPLKVYSQTSGVFNKHIASIILGRGLRYLCSIKDFNVGTLGFATESLACGEYGFEGFEYNGVAYKLSGRIEEYRAFNNDFKICFDKLRAFYIYFNPTAEVARNLIERCLNYLSAIKSEGFSIQKAFKDSPLLEKYYKECLHSDIKAFVQAIGYENEDLKSLYNIIAKVKRALSKTD